MDTDIRDEIAHSFGDGPPPGPPEDLLVRGRRALRRRRLAETGAAMAVSLAAIGVALVGTGGSGPGSAPQPAAPDHSVSPAPTPHVDTPAFPPPPDATPVRDPRLAPDWAVDLRPDGVHVAPGVTVLRVVDDPWGLRVDQAWSAAVVYRDRRGTRTWFAGYVGVDLGGESTSIPAANADEGDFDAWVHHQGVVLAPHAAGSGPQASPVGEASR